jgi:hypothetical protein
MSLKLVRLRSQQNMKETPFSLTPFHEIADTNLFSPAPEAPLLLCGLIVSTLK